MKDAYHALVLNLHQPAGNLYDLLDFEPWQTEQILYAIDRIPRVLWKYKDVGRVHLAMSGTLLEVLSDPAFQSRFYGVVDCGSMLWHLQNRSIIEILGTGYYHPVLPLIPEADREEHLKRWQGIAHHLFWRSDFTGFWPPEMGFSMELIPLLKRMGYRWVLVDSEHVEAITPMSWHELRYRPHIARHGDDEIIVVVRDRELSNAQESGMEFGWFQNEVAERTRWCDFPALLTTCTDGDNGGWFRNTSETGGFWGEFYPAYMNAVYGDTAEVQPTFIDDYLNQHGAVGEVRVNTGAWNTGWHNGHGFLQWTGSEKQRATLAALPELSQQVHDARWRAGEQHETDPKVWERLEDAMWHLLRAETSCNYFWGEAWVDRAEADLAHVREALKGVD
jgi:alpha-amylase/alpha-mannosidase (GH57 family)